jgi:hypothetical protein
LGILISEIAPRVLGWLETSPLPLRTLHLWANPFPKNNYDMSVPFALSGGMFLLIKSSPSQAQVKAAIIIKNKKFAEASPIITMTRRKAQPPTKRKLFTLSLGLVKIN